jgi:hypothetical protein
LNDSQRTIVYLYEKGYRVDQNGVFRNPKGNELPIKLKSNHKYPQTQVIMEGKKRNFHIHRLAAYCFYGDLMFKEGIHVRHLNANPLDLSKDNIVLGTPSENERDKPKELRIKNAKYAVSCRKDTRRLSLRKLTNDQIIEIKKRLSRNEKGVDIARDYSVSKETIYKIRRGKSYTDVN